MSYLLLPIVLIFCLFVLLPALLLHYILQFRRARTLSDQDEQTLDSLYDLANRIDQRLNSVERILDAEDPHWRSARPRGDERA